ncbi:hypothetical protein M8C13_04365 [Crossiella sp. SN42]|uniref:hypothetical protein n=1 Tax=Crossiella sp. SN42 TaxID=2944808 RepID=UPI00207C6CE9|nr:hypothetical protein [Crossiella sp. SN42]MCO1574992.1 hypothetical protein [Crossiella sp. SN42]
MTPRWWSRLTRRATTARYSRDTRWPPPALPAELLGRCPDCGHTPKTCEHWRTQ